MRFIAGAKPRSHTAAWACWRPPASSCRSVCSSGPVAYSCRIPSVPEWTDPRLVLSDAPLTEFVLARLRRRSFTPSSMAWAARPSIRSESCQCRCGYS
eukprot:scaffold27604_cov141-Isochrysis_galbana.AAC.3